MSEEIMFFNPTFYRTQSEAIKWIVDNQLSPSPLGRDAFCESHLQKAVQTGEKHYTILASGYNSFAYRQPEWAKKINIFEVDQS